MSAGYDCTPFPRYRSPEDAPNLLYGAWIRMGIEHRYYTAFWECLPSGLGIEYPELHQWGTPHIYIEEQRGQLALVIGDTAIKNLSLEQLEELFSLLFSYLEKDFREGLLPREIEPERSCSVL